MIIDVPFVSRVPVIPPRGRTPRLVWVLDLESLAVRDISEEDFPVAAVIDYRDDDGDMHHGVNVRTDGHRFFRQSEAPEFSRFAEEIAAGTSGSPLGGQQWLRAAGRRAEDTVRRVDIVGRVADDPRAERVTALAAAAASMVICDGRVYEVCGEPCFKIEWSREAVEIQATLLEPGQLETDPGTLCRADRIENLTGLPFLDDEKPVLVGAIEVVRADLLRLSPATPGLINAAADTVRKMSRDLASRIMTADRAELDAFAGLRDALMTDPDGAHITSFRDIPRTEVSETLAGAIREFIAAAPGNDSTPLAGAYRRWEQEQIRNLGAAAEVARMPSAR